MRYQMDRENYCRFDVMQRSKLSARSYIVPFASREKADAATVSPDPPKNPMAEPVGKTFGFYVNSFGVRLIA